MPQISAQVKVTQGGAGKTESMRTGPVVTVIPDQNKLAVQRILDLGEGDYVVTVNAQRNIERFVKLPSDVRARDLLAALDDLRHKKEPVDETIDDNGLPGKRERKKK